MLQKSKVAGRRICREKTKQKAIDDSYNLSRVTEIACEFSPMALCCSPVEGGATLEATPGKQPRAVAGLDLAT